MVMLHINEEVRKIVREASTQFPDDTKQATAQALSIIRGLPNIGQIMEELLQFAVQQLVYDARHDVNTAIKRVNGEYGGPARFSRMETPELQEVYQSIYNYRINGSVLGDLKGKELPGLIDKETKVANGHLFNAELLKWLYENGVTGETTVREKIKPGKLQTTFASLSKKYNGPGTSEAS